MNENMSEPEQTKCPDCSADAQYRSPANVMVRHERGGRDCLRRQLAQRDATIAKLQAIMDRLPKTADGVVMLPNDTVWFADPWAGKVRSAKLPALGCKMTYPPFVCADDLTEPDYLTRDVPSVEWYSTRAAIELAAAQAADLPGGGGNGDDR